jgi:hypothetical protein
LAGFLALALLALSIPISLLGTAQADVIPSTLTIRFGQGQTIFKGKVSSDLDECKGLRLVRVFKVRPGADKRVGSDLTSPTGRWSVDVRKADGRYYAKVSRLDIGGYYGQEDTCGKDRSTRIEV